MLTNMLDLLNEARLKKHSIIQFNINNLEWIKYILTTCEEENIHIHTHTYHQLYTIPHIEKIFKIIL